MDFITTFSKEFDLKKEPLIMYADGEKGQVFKSKLLDRIKPRCPFDFEWDLAFGGKSPNRFLILNKLGVVIFDDTLAAGRITVNREVKSFGYSDFLSALGKFDNITTIMMEV